MATGNLTVPAGCIFAGLLRMCSLSFALAWAVPLSGGYTLKTKLIDPSLPLRTKASRDVIRRARFSPSSPTKVILEMRHRRVNLPTPGFVPVSAIVSSPMTAGSEGEQTA